MAVWGVSANGVSALGGYLPCRCLSGGVVCLVGLSAQGVGVCQDGCVHLPLWTEFLTHACENITFPQLRLRTVITVKIKYDFIFVGIALPEGSPYKDVFDNM